MNLDPLRIAEHAHGHLGWLAAISLVHPAIVLRRKTRRAHWAVGLSVAIVTATAALGVAMYGDYRDKLRQWLFQHGPTYGYLFERKEHLAFAAVMLAWSGAVAYFGAGWVAGDVRLRLRTAAHWAFVAAASLAVAAAVLGTLVASFRTF